MAIKSIPSWRFPACSEGLDGDVRHLCQIHLQLISAICHVLRWQMTAWRWQKGSERAAAPWWVSNSCLYPTLPFPISWLPSFLSFFPPRGNMAFEVNTICFVAFLWWLNNGLKHVAKWESEARDGSNLAFLSERWHRPIEINESTRVLTLSLL